MDVSHVVDMSMLLNTCKSVEEVIGLNTWNVENLERIDSFIYYNSGLNTLDISNWNAPKLKNTTYMIRFCDNLESINISNWNVPLLQATNRMFANNPALVSIDMRGWDNNFSNCQSIEGMFEQTPNLVEVKGDDKFDFTNIDLSSMYGCFGNTQFANSFDIKITPKPGAPFNSLFGEMASNIESINFSKFNTSELKKEKSVQALFLGMSNLKSIPGIENFDSSDIENFAALFNGCSSLEEIDLSKWDFSNAKNTSSMFYNASNIKTEITINSHIEGYGSMFTGAATTPSSQIIVNYTQEAADIIDDMIATKSENSNVIKGRLIK